MDEEHALNPRSPYAATKAGADRSRIRTPSRTTCRSSSCGRSTTGPRQHPEKLIPRFITSALEDEPLTVHGDGSASRDWLFVDDDAEAIEAAVEADLDAVSGEVINVATGIDLSVTEIADLVLEALDKPASLKEHVEERPGRVQRRRLHRQGGPPSRWTARTRFETGLERTVAWYRDNEAWWRGFSLGT